MKVQTTGSGQVEQIEESSRARYSIDSGTLVKVGARPALADYLREIFRLRNFILKRARFRSLSSGKGTILGKAWLLLEPFMQIGMYFVVFGLIIKTDRGIDNFVAYLAIGVIFFRKIQSSMSEGAGLISSNRGIIRAFPIPRASLAFSDAIKKFYDSIPDLIALLIFISIVPPTVKPAWTWLLSLPILMLLILFSTGVSFLTARLSVSIPDLKHLWPIVGRFWFYGSGVIFSIDRYVHDPTLRSVVSANPAAVFLEAAREAILHHNNPALGIWLQLLGWSLFISVAGFLAFWLNEEKYNREI